jgi:hypothetical protein
MRMGLILPISRLAARWGAAASFAAALATFAAPAAAQSPICADLQQQYLAAFGTRGSTGMGQRMLNMEAISRELANAQMAARQGNCNRFLFFGPRPSPECPAILSTIGRLRQQIAQARSGGSLFQFSPQRERDRLRDWLMQNGCDIPQRGGVRTVCVRTCDGYFFPISYSTSRQHFPRDAEVCQSMYAQSGQADLFTYSTSRDVGEAVSVSGQRYGDQPYAFLYRQGFFPSCQSQLKEGIAALGARYFQARTERVTAEPGKAMQAAFVYPMPRMRPLERWEDPETNALRAGGLAVARYVPEPEGAPVAAANGGMRRVGASYYAELFDPDKPSVVAFSHRPPIGFDLLASAKATIASRSDTVPEPAGVSELR